MTSFVMSCIQILAVSFLLQFLFLQGEALPKPQTPSSYAIVIDDDLAEEKTNKTRRSNPLMLDPETMSVAEMNAIKLKALISYMKMVHREKAPTTRSQKRVVTLRVSRKTCSTFCLWKINKTYFIPRCETLEADITVKVVCYICRHIRRCNIDSVF